jgi:phosphomannomutase
MKKYKALFAGEHSGHFYFRDNYNAESSLIAGLLLLEYISVTNLKSSEIIKSFSKYFSSGETSYKVKDANEVMKKLEEKYSKSAKNIDHIDGLSVWFDDYWFNIRPSKTEPLLRLNLEADSKEILVKQINTVKEFIISGI